MGSPSKKLKEVDKEKRDYFGDEEENEDFERWCAWENEDQSKESGKIEVVVRITNSYLPKEWQGFELIQLEASKKKNKEGQSDYDWFKQEWETKGGKDLLLGVKVVDPTMEEVKVTGHLYLESEFIGYRERWYTGFEIEKTERRVGDKWIQQ